MFSASIKNYINDSGQVQAQSRIQELDRYVKSVNNTLNPAQGVKPFGEVLKTTSAPKSIFTVNSTAQPFSTYATSNVSYTKEQLMSMVEKLADKHGVDEKLVKALIKQESGFNPKATSKVGAMGLMQLMPSTAKGLGVSDPYNPYQNVEGGIKYLKSMLERFNGNTILALAAYNAGPNAVKKYNDVPPYGETQRYVRAVLKDYID